MQGLPSGRPHDSATTINVRRKIRLPCMPCRAGLSTRTNWIVYMPCVPCNAVYCHPASQATQPRDTAQFAAAGWLIVARLHAKHHAPARTRLLYAKFGSSGSAWPSASAVRCWSYCWRTSAASWSPPGTAGAGMNLSSRAAACGLDLYAWGDRNTACCCLASPCAGDGSD